MRAGILSLAVLLIAPRLALADIGPMDPARKICMGALPGSACTIDGKAGTCEGAHASRMYCTPGKGKANATAKRKPAPPDVLAEPDTATAVVADPPPPPPVALAVPAAVTPPAPAAAADSSAAPARTNCCSVSTGQAAPSIMVIVLGFAWMKRRRRPA